MYIKIPLQCLCLPGVLGFSSLGFSILCFNIRSGLVVYLFTYTTQFAYFFPVSLQIKNTYFDKINFFLRVLKTLEFSSPLFSFIQYASPNLYSQGYRGRVSANLHRHMAIKPGQIT